MSKENLAPKYNPKEVEQGRYNEWVEQGYFEPNGNRDVEPYSIVIPPPNVTGKLHLGHAWDTTLQDMIIRQKRMQGYDTVYLPGMDHAGIATQAKVEAKLAEEEGKSRYDLGREAFVDKVWEWKDEYASTIKSQWAKLGLSLDYSRERFTLDEGLSKAVNKVFVDLYNKGLIYRGEYIINWDPKAQTALSDIEVIHKDIEGAFYHIRYDLVDGSGSLEIATTRPETMFGDTALIVNPNDKRYQDVIGKEVYLPLTDKKIPVLADEHADMETGTGVVKITPAHDPNDFEVGNRHNLPRVNVMNDDATMNENAYEFEGMDRFEARRKLIERLEKEGHLVKIEKMTHSVGHSERTGVVVEPRLSTQWFVRMEPLAKAALDNQQTDNAVNFYPPRFENTFKNWMENVHDWVISRQLWWGHRIPAWYNKQTGEMYVSKTAPEDIENWEQDKDVLDTWFSSALWPFSTMGWPDTDSEDFKRYFPTNTLVTGYDIIFFWVSRMIFQSLEFTDERPFENVLIHGLIRDEQGKKMSKSLGNGIDPMDVIDQYGADALRWFLANGSAPGQDTRFSYTKMDSAWNFINKIWNASRYVIMNLPDDMQASDVNLQADKMLLPDRWILTKLNQTIQSVTELFDKFEFGEAGRVLYNFIWDDFCDWYIEMSKEVLYGDDEEQKTTTYSVLVYVLDNMLRLLHPIMPFVTEEIWQMIPHEGKSLVIAKYPEVDNDYIFKEDMELMTQLIDLIRSVRNIRSEVNTPLSKPITLILKANDEMTKERLLSNKQYIERFCNPSELIVDTKVDVPKDSMSAVITGVEIFLPLKGLIDISEEISRLEKEASKLDSEIERVQKKLSNERFVANAPKEVVDKEKEKEADYLEKAKAVSERLETLKNL